MSYLTEVARFHHTGVAALDFEESQKLLEALGFRREGAEFSDTLQGVKGVFMVFAGNRIEVLSDLPGQSTVGPWLKGAALAPYHLGYEVPDMNEALTASHEAGFRVVREPMPAVAFADRNIAFVMTRSRFLIEFIEEGPIAPPSAGRDIDG